MQTGSGNGGSPGVSVVAQQCNMLLCVLLVPGSNCGNTEAVFSQLSNQTHDGQGRFLKQL